MLYERDKDERLRAEFLWRYGKPRIGQLDIAWARERSDVLLRQSTDRMHHSLRYVWAELTRNVGVLAEADPLFLPMSAAITAATFRYSAMASRVEAAQDELLNVLTQGSADFMAIKGAADRYMFSSCWPGEDLDVFVPDLDAGWQVISLAEAVGYQLDRIKVTRSSRRQRLHSGPVSANGSLYRSDARHRRIVQADWDLGAVRTLDLHVGAFPSAGECVLSAPIFERRVQRRRGEIETAVPSMEDVILIELAHIVKQGTFNRRGVNRINLALESAPLDVSYLVSAIRENRLDGVAHTVLNLIQSWADESPDAAGVIAEALGSLPSRLSIATRRIVGFPRVDKHGSETPSSLWLVLDYLVRSTLRQHGVPRGLVAALASTSRAVRNYPITTRAHPRWKERRVGFWSGRVRAAMFHRLDRRPAELARAVHGAPNAIPVGRALVVNSGRDDEVLLTPVGSFTSGPYAAEIPLEQRTSCEQVARSWSPYVPAEQRVIGAPAP